jgi:hypothetical protein
MAEVLKFGGTQIGDLVQRATMRVEIGGGTQSHIGTFRDAALIDAGASPNLFYVLKVYVSYNATSMADLAMWAATMGELAGQGKLTAEITGGSADLTLPEARMKGTPEVPLNVGRAPKKANMVMIEFWSSERPTQ